MTNSEAMYEMQLELEMHLVKIQKVFIRYKLPLTRVTLLARDPANDSAIIVLGNEDDAGLEKACQLALAKVQYSE